jgi:hypothetical protein
MSCQSQLEKAHRPDGIWDSASSKDFSNSSLSYYSVNNNLYMTHFFKYKGQPFFEIGRGTYENGVLKYNVKVIQNIDDWPNEGYHQLTLSEDGKEMNGFYIDANGRRGSLRFARQK